MIKAKKSFGQHFLRDEHIARRIAECLTLPAERVLEVGPGQGVLTRHLLEVYPQSALKVVEADRDMVQCLRGTFAPEAFEIIEDDFLKTRLAQVFEGQPFALIGNYPYNISSQIFIKTIDNRDLIPEMAGMFQKEVAERITALPDTEHYGTLSVLAQAWYEPRYLFTVKPGSFNPPPKVQSGVIRLVRKEGVELGCSEAAFRKVVKAAFAMRRKMLRNTLSSLLPREELMDEPFFMRRAETLSLDEFVSLARRVEAQAASRKD